MQQRTNAELPEKINESLAVKGYYLFPSVLLSVQYEMLIDKLEALWLEEGESAAGLSEFERRLLALWS